VVKIIRKGEPPQPIEAPAAVRNAAQTALCMTLPEPRPEGFPLLFSSDIQLIEPAVAFLHVVVLSNLLVAHLEGQVT
jgi:integrase/recombinase XerD